MDPTANATPGGLRLQPNMIPRLTRAYQEALDQLAPASARRRRVSAAPLSASTS
ncbi:MAG: hypothetical protein M3Z25_12435 [Actinomycetota bacterium]|nr:hypothetical protein [Actinomycetota bacterium]